MICVSIADVLLKRPVTLLPEPRSVKYALID
jgi:hypothetical protein